MVQYPGHVENSMGYDPVVGSRLSYHRLQAICASNSPGLLTKPAPHSSTPTALQQTRPLGRGQVGIVQPYLYDTERLEKSLDATQDFKS